MKIDTIRNFAERYVAWRRGDDPVTHCDARIISEHPDHIIVHAGTINEWHPCGHNEVINADFVIGYRDNIPQDYADIMATEP